MSRKSVYLSKDTFPLLVTLSVFILFRSFVSVACVDYYIDLFLSVGHLISQILCCGNVWDLDQ